MSNYYIILHLIWAKVQTNVYFLKEQEQKAWFWFQCLEEQLICLSEKVYYFLKKKIEKLYSTWDDLQFEVMTNQKTLKRNSLYK